MEKGVSWWDSKENSEDMFPFWIIVDRLADIILRYVGGCVVEIGLGYSTKMLAKHARNLGIKHYAVDVKRSRCRIVEKNPECQHDGLIIYCGKSLNFIKEFDDDPGLVFIDGCHNAEVVLQEAMFFISKLLPGGVIFFHDMYQCEDWELKHKEEGRSSNTYRVRWELENLKNVWCFTFPYTAGACGLTMVMKRPEYEYNAKPLDLVGEDHPRDSRLSGRNRWCLGDRVR